MSRFYSTPNRYLGFYHIIAMTYKGCYELLAIIHLVPRLWQMQSMLNYYEDQWIQLILIKDEPFWSHGYHWYYCSLSEYHLDLLDILLYLFYQLIKRICCCLFVYLVLMIIVNFEPFLHHLMNLPYLFPFLMFVFLSNYFYYYYLIRCCLE